MALESITHISDLVVTNPTSSDAKSQGDDHIRGIKLALKTDFPNITGAVTPTHTELNYVDGVTSAIQTQIDAKAAHAGQTYTGTHAFAGATGITVPTKSASDNTTAAASTAYVDAADALKANLASPPLTGTPTAPTASTGTATTQIATTAFVGATAFSAALPSQTGNSGKYVTTDGSNASWATVTPPQVVRQARTSNTILAAGDSQNLIDITSGTFSQTFTEAATLASGWFVYLRNSGSGLITLDPNGAELIDGLATYIMYPGECRLVQCTGTAFTSVVLTPFNYTTASTVTFTTPPGYAFFGGLLWGGGGGGGRSNALGVAVGGGGGGACVPFVLTPSKLGTSKTITIGAGGTAVTSPTAAAGGTGGTSDIGSTLALAYGGGGGGGNAVDRFGGGGGGSMGAGNAGTASNGIGGLPARQTFNVIATPSVGTAGGYSGTTEDSGANAEYGGGAGGYGTVSGHIAGNTLYGGGGGGGVSAANAVGTVGTSKFGGGSGGAGSSAGAASAGSVPGGGGGANQTGSTSGAGGAGQCIIWGIV